jgi:hypothetical protein
LKYPFTSIDIAKINHEIIEKIHKVDLFQNERLQKLWKNKVANLVFCYFGRDETDIINCNYLCHTTWADDTQDKKWWYRNTNINYEIIDGIHFSFHPYYDSLKTFSEEQTSNKETLVTQTKTIMSSIIDSAENVISGFHAYTNGDISEDEFVDSIASDVENIEKKYFQEGSLDIAPDDIHEWSQAISVLAGTIFDFTFFYNSKYISTRTSENRRNCMNDTVNRYYRDIEKLRNIEIKLIDSSILVANS